MIKIIHTADTHLGYKQYQSDVRKRDFFDSFDQIINEAIELNIDAVIHAGDLFDTRTPTLDDIILTTKLLKKLSKKKIPFLCIVGNHEMKQNNQWIDLFQQMNLCIRLTSNPYKLSKNDLNINIYGLDNISIYKYNNIKFENFFTNDDSSNYSILVMHQLLSPIVSGNTQFSYLDFLNKFTIDFDILLLGDYHKYEDKTLEYFSLVSKKNKTCRITYSGSTERCSISELEQRYYNIISFFEDSILITKKPLNTRDFILLKEDCSNEINSNSLYEKIIRTIDTHEKEIENSVVFLELIGNSDLLLNLNNIYEYILNKKAIVGKIIDNRNNKQKIEISNNIIFQDPNNLISEVLKNEKNMYFGSFIDKLIRDLEIPKTKIIDYIDEEVKIYLNNINEHSKINIKETCCKNKKEEAVKKVKQYTLDSLE